MQVDRVSLAPTTTACPDLFMHILLDWPVTKAEDVCEHDAGLRDSTRGITADESECMAGK